MSRKALWRRRVSVIGAIYSELVLSSSGQVFDPDSLIDLDWGDFEINILRNYLNNKSNYYLIAERFLKDTWTIDRLNLMSLSILYEAIAEFDALRTPANILIQQSVKTAKNYCDENEYKLINGLLENCLNHMSLK